MLISRTPLRISFAGGGSDFPEFYEKEGGGVISTTIDKYIYVLVNKSFSDRIHVSYSKKETCKYVDEVKHDLVRECMKKVGITGGIEITTMADVPSEGTGLGSSSSLTVGLLNALYTYVGKECDKETLAQDACEIELNILQKPIGKQDQYAAAYGGLRLYNFHRDGMVSIERLKTNPNNIQQLASELMLFYTDMTRQSADILREQRDHIQDNIEIFRSIRDQVMPMKAALLENRGVLGNNLDWGWRCKKELAGTITNTRIDTLYRKAKMAGASGGKISGAGGGGFLLLHCSTGSQQSVREALKDLKELPFNFEEHGSVILTTVPVGPIIGGPLPNPGRWHSGVRI